MLLQKTFKCHSRRSYVYKLDKTNKGCRQCLKLRHTYDWPVFERWVDKRRNIVTWTRIRRVSSVTWKWLDHPTTSVGLYGPGGLMMEYCRYLFVVVGRDTHYCCCCCVWWNWCWIGHAVGKEKMWYIIQWKESTFITDLV